MVEKHVGVKNEPSAEEVATRKNSLTRTDKTKWQRLWPVIACGAGLFSDGYLNGVIGSVGTMLAILYPTQYTKSPAQSNVASIAFVGTLVSAVSNDSDFIQTIWLTSRIMDSSVTSSSAG